MKNPKIRTSNKDIYLMNDHAWTLTKNLKTLKPLLELGCFKINKNNNLENVTNGRIKVHE